MTDSLNKLAKTIEAVLGDKADSVRVAHGELTVEVAPEHLHEAMLTLRDNDNTRFEQLLDVAGVDYAAYGQDEWITDASSVGFSRGVTGTGADVGRLGITGIYGVHDIKENTGRRFCATYHLLSISLNHRMRVKTYAADDAFPVIDSVVDIWSGANWFEREAFDLYGIVFDGHPDLRRILTDYGFVGHPFRKDFPLIGNVEVRYDDEKGRVIYQPVTIEPRVLVPRVVREDSRYADRTQQEGQADG